MKWRTTKEDRIMIFIMIVLAALIVGWLYLIETQQDPRIKAALRFQTDLKKSTP